LNQTAEYALRSMAVLAQHWPAERLNGATLASECNIPGHYLSKIMRRLVVAGLVESRKGHGGGFLLSRSPTCISFMEVLQAVDFEMPGGRCAFGVGECDADNPCPLHPAYTRLNDSFLSWARGTMLVRDEP
jgi:Rrf2 family protein